MCSIVSACSGFGGTRCGAMCWARLRRRVGALRSVARWRMGARCGVLDLGGPGERDGLLAALGREDSPAGRYIAAGPKSARLDARPARTLEAMVCCGAHGAECRGTFWSSVWADYERRRWARATWLTPGPTVPAHDSRVAQPAPGAHTGGEWGRRASAARRAAEMVYGACDSVDAFCSCMCVPGGGASDPLRVRGTAPERALADCRRP